MQHVKAATVYDSECPRDSAPPERPLTFAPPECPLEVVEFHKNLLEGSLLPLLTETPDPPWPMESPDPSWLPETLGLPWPPKLPASVLETICALSASCVSVSSRSQSLPGVAAPPWRVPAPPWRAPAPVSSAPPRWAPVSSAPPRWAPVSSAPPWWAPVSSAPPWWAPVSSAPPWWAPVSSAPPWWAPVSSAPPWWAADLPESPHVSADLPESPHVSADLPESPHVSADRPESPHVSATTDLPESRHATAVYPVSLHVSAVSSAPPWWAPVSFAPHGPGPPFPPPVPPPLHRPPGLLYVWSVWKPLFGGGGALSRIWLPFHHMDSCTTLQLHITPPQTTTPIIHCTHKAHSSHHCTITQLSPIAHLPWLSCHTCTSFTHPHISSTLPCTHCEVLFSPI